MRLLLLLFLSALALPGCRKHSATLHRSAVPSTLVAGMFISTGGTFTHADATITRELTVTPGPKDLIPLH